MSGRYLLDTNIIIAIFADDIAVKNNLAQASEIFLPSIAVGFSWDEEIDRLKKGELVGEYSVDIGADKQASKQKLVA